MVYSNRSAEFRLAVEDQLKSIPETKRRHVKHVKHRGTKHADGEKGEQSWGDAFLNEAYTILQHIVTLNKMLVSIRRPYLNVDSSFGPSRRRHDQALGMDSKEGWEGVKHLTNQERDEIDLQAKVILKRCADRVKQMESWEKDNASSNSSRNAILRFLPARLKLPGDGADSEFIAAHRASITWYLNRRLAEASNSQRELQEERVRRQLERAKSLGSTVGRDYPPMNGSTSTLAGRQGSTERPVIPKFDSTLASSYQSSHSFQTDTDEDDLALSPAQVQMFEQENEAILRSAENVLAAVEKAESSLLEIGALQTELVQHLTVQTEMTDRLYEEAMSTQAEVEKGNAQLRKAKERGGDARRWLLIFLSGASLALLFVHYYK